MVQNSYSSWYSDLISFVILHMESNQIERQNSANVYKMEPGSISYDVIVHDFVKNSYIHTFI